MNFLVFNIDIKPELPGNFDRYLSHLFVLSTALKLKDFIPRVTSPTEAGRRTARPCLSVFPRCVDKYYFTVWDLAALSPTRCKIRYVIKLNADLVECVLH